MSIKVTVTRIIDGDTFVVSPGWEWQTKHGDRIRPTKLCAPEIDEDEGEEAAEKLADLILDESVELRNAVRIDRGRLVCDVYYDGQELVDYFPEYEC